MKKDLRDVSFKNYIILSAIIVVTLLLLYYFYVWVDVYKESKINIPIMDKYMDVINYNELDNYLVENPNAMLYVSVLDNEEIRRFEKDLKNQFEEKKINNKLLYLNITSLLADKNVVNEMKNKYRVNNLSMVDVPSILVFSLGELKSIYNIRDNKYNVENVVDFINGINMDVKGL